MIDGMENSSDGRGIALHCDHHGVIIEVARDELGLGRQFRPGVAFAVAVGREGMAKALSLLQEIRTKGAAFGWELNVTGADEILRMHCAGIILDDMICVLGALTRTDLLTLYEDLSRINNEQLNALRFVLKEQADVAHRQSERDAGFYNEISKLNNELASLQRQLAKQNAELEQLNQQKNQLLGIAAHDLRSPLGVIMSYSEFLLEEAAPLLSDEHREFLSVIRSSSDFMRQLVDDLLDVSKIESGRLELNLELTDLGGLLGHVVSLNQVLAAPKNITLVWDRPNTLPKMPVDAIKLEQVLNNLITNAVKYSPTGSRVLISAHHSDESVEIRVQDSGPGIPANEQDKLFKAFGTTSTKSTDGEKSTGLGLMIARRIVEGHGGSIWVESEPGRGATFCFTLPIDAPPPGVQETEVLHIHAHSTDRGNGLLPLRILLADDIELNRRIMQRLLAQVGYEADEAVNGREVLTALARESYDLVLLDLHMPQMDGWEVARRIRMDENGPRPPWIVGVTASAQGSVRQECIDAGMDECVAKPLDLASLRRVLEAATASRNRMT
jgi:two-component system, OmpR family, sensor kinase